MMINLSADAKTLIIYHQYKGGSDCSDGLAAAWVAAKRYSHHELMGWGYEKPDPPLINKAIKRIVVVDFSFPSSILEGWADKGIDVMIIDHHKSAMKQLDGLANTVFKVLDMNECGATLAWKTFFPYKPIPDFLGYIRDRDLWEHRLPSTRVISEAIYRLRSELRQLYKNDLEYYDRVFALFDALSSAQSFSLGALAQGVCGNDMQALFDLEKSIARRWKPCTLDGHEGAVVLFSEDGSEDMHRSWVASHVYKTMCPDVEFVAMITSRCTCELRSDKDKPGGGLDVGSIALSHGGGGHHNAAGFNLPGVSIEEIARQLASCAKFDLTLLSK